MIYQIRRNQIKHARAKRSKIANDVVFFGSDNRPAGAQTIDQMSTMAPKKRKSVKTAGETAKAAKPKGNGRGKSTVAEVAQDSNTAATEQPEQSPACASETSQIQRSGLGLYFVKAASLPAEHGAKIAIDCSVGHPVSAPASSAPASSSSTGVHAKCVKCKKETQKGQGYSVSVGRLESDIWKCVCCNRLEGRVRTVQKANGELAKDWINLPAEQLAAFYAESEELTGAALLQKMRMVVTLHKEKISEAESGKKGLFHPRSYYEHNLKYTKEQCDNIEKLRKRMG